jgi:hypothetical protein
VWDCFPGFARVALSAYHSSKIIPKSYNMKRKRNFEFELFLDSENHEPCTDTNATYSSLQLTSTASVLK